MDRSNDAAWLERHQQHVAEGLKEYAKRGQKYGSTEYTGLHRGIDQAKAAEPDRYAQIPTDEAVAMILARWPAVGF